MLFMFSSIQSFYFYLFKQKTAYEMRISDWSSDVCSSDLHRRDGVPARQDEGFQVQRGLLRVDEPVSGQANHVRGHSDPAWLAGNHLASHRRGHHEHRLALDARCLRAGDRKSTSLNSSPYCASRMPSYA